MERASCCRRRTTPRLGLPPNKLMVIVSLHSFHAAPINLNNSRTYFTAMMLSTEK